MTKPQHVRRFDWDEARGLRDSGMAYTKIAERLGVSAQAIRRVLIPGEYERMDAASSAWLRGGTCERCGGSCTRGHDYCAACLPHVQATTVREHELQCTTCREWKPDDAFAGDKRRVARRGRHRQCSECGTKARAAYRKAHLEKQRAYDREYKRRHRVAA